MSDVNPSDIFLQVDIGDEFLAFLVSSAAGEARDQLRDEALHQTGLVISITRRVGATGASGNTYEPYLSGCARPDYLLPAYANGRNLGDFIKA